MIVSNAVSLDYSQIQNNLNGGSMKTKVCSKCGEELELNAENFHKSKRDGFQSKCKKCRNEKGREYIKENREDRNEKSKKYYIKNKKKISSKSKESYIKNKEKIDERNKENKKKRAKHSTYKDKLFADEIREAESDILEVKCKQCRKWFKPTNSQVRCRIDSLNIGEESNFYCSQECKNSCKIHRKKPETLEKQDELNAGIYKIHKHEGFYIDSELSIWSQQVIGNAKNKCEICGQASDLRAHHIMPKSEYPKQALDPLNGACLCEECHKKVHNQTGCGTGQLRKC